MVTAKLPILDAATTGVKLWLFTAILSGIEWTVCLLVIDGRRESYSDLIAIGFIAACCSAVLSLTALPGAIFLLPVMLARPRQQRFADIILLILVLWLLSNLIAVLLLAKSQLLVSSALAELLYTTLPNLATAFVVAAYVYRPWLFNT